jgi:hypothetical protein
MSLDLAWRFWVALGAFGPITMYMIRRLLWVCDWLHGATN